MVIKLTSTYFILVLQNPPIIALYILDSVLIGCFSSTSTKILQVLNSLMTTRPDIYYVFIFRCAPEFCAKRMLSSASDVWSYGIVMWEIFSGGREPNICKTDIVLKDIAMHIIEKGCRLEKPEKCSDSGYQLMQDCWKMAPECRPDFTGLVKQLQ